MDSATSLKSVMIRFRKPFCFDADDLHTYIHIYIVVGYLSNECSGMQVQFACQVSHKLLPISNVLLLT